MSSRRREHRPRLTASAASPPAAPASTTAPLPPPPSLHLLASPPLVQENMATHCETPDLLRMGAIARACLAFYPRQAIQISLYEASWINDPIKPENEAEWQEWSEKHTRILVRLLQRLPLLARDG